MFGGARFPNDQLAADHAVAFMERQLQDAGIDLRPIATRRLVRDFSLMVRDAIAERAPLVHRRGAIDGADVLIDVTSSTPDEWDGTSFVDVIDLRRGPPECISVRLVVVPSEVEATAEPRV